MAIPDDSCSIGSLYAIKKQLVLLQMDICEGLWPLPALPERNACNELVSDKMLSAVGGLETVQIPCCKHRFGSWRGQMMERER